MTEEDRPWATFSPHRRPLSARIAILEARILKHQTGMLYAPTSQRPLPLQIHSIRDLDLNSLSLSFDESVEGLRRLLPCQAVADQQQDDRCRGFSTHDIIPRSPLLDLREPHCLRPEDKREEHHRLAVAGEGTCCSRPRPRPHTTQVLRVLLAPRSSVGSLLASRRIEDVARAHAHAPSPCPCPLPRKERSRGKARGQALCSPRFLCSNKDPYCEASSQDPGH
nr:unnamed protein product [Digitaria exilis]